MLQIDSRLRKIEEKRTEKTLKRHGDEEKDRVHRKGAHRRPVEARSFREGETARNKNDGLARGNLER